MKTTFPIIKKRVVLGQNKCKSEAIQSGKIMTSQIFTCTWYGVEKK